MIENLQLALESLLANKMRTLLTMLGIIIGIASVIAIISLGDVMTSFVSEEMASVGTNNIYVSVRERASEGEDVDPRMALLGRTSSVTIPDQDLLTDEHIQMLYDHFDGQIRAVSVSASKGSGQIRQRGTYANVSVSGINVGNQTISDYELVDGRLLTQKDMDDKRGVCLISDRARDRLFDAGESPLGQEISVYLSNEIVQYTVVGVYRYEDSAFTMGMGGSASQVSTSVYVPVTVIMAASPSKNYSSMTIMLEQGYDLLDYTPRINDFLNRFYRLNTRFEAYVFNVQSQVEMAMSMIGLVSTVIAVIAGISLLVGGIGVMNIMLVSVTERTHEIGIRKALGARDAHIRMQFVTEAMMVAMIGGIFGVILGLLGGMLGAFLVGEGIVFNPLVIVGTVLFSMLIGVFFGYYPANKAARLNPIDALRYE